VYIGVTVNPDLSTASTTVTSASELAVQEAPHAKALLGKGMGY